MKTTHPKIRRQPIIRLFVSSPFSDMKHERNILQERVFPNLELLCSPHGFQFQAIDLRWGVSSEAGLDHRTIRICLDEVRRAQEVSPRPNFLILLGNRYGWRNLPEEITVAEFQTLAQAAARVPTTTGQAATTVLQAWYRRDENAAPPVYLLQSRHQQLPDKLDYTQDAHWNKVQPVLWEIINRALPPEQLSRRFDEAVLTQDAPPPIVRFQGSATEHEIWQGLLIPAPQEHVLAFFRQIENVAEFSESEVIERMKNFVDLTPSGSLDTVLFAEQELLKKELRKRLGPENVFEVDSTRLVPAIDNKGLPTADVTTDHLDQLCRHVETRLTEIILEQIAEYWHQTTQDSPERTAQELKFEQEEHKRFGGERGGKESFVGRETELQLIRDYLRDASTRTLVVHGASGCGKTALLARAAEEIQSPSYPVPSAMVQGTMEAKHPVVMTRFIGVTPRSSEIRLLLGSLCQELRLHYPREDALPTDITALREELHAQFRSATPEQPLFLFLDALDQLADADGGRLLSWIPRGDLPAHVKVVVSCLSDRAKGDPAGQPYAELRDRSLPEEHFIPLDALPEMEAGQLLFARWLPQVARTLSRDQRQRITQRLASPECRQPIYLKLLFEEARLWPSYGAAQPLGEGVSALLALLFARLSLPANHGPLLVERVLGYLAASQHGLAENEILEILFRDPEYKAALDHATAKTRHELPASAKRIPIALWSRLRFDLAPYLSERAAGGVNVLTFYHRQVAEWVQDHLAKETQQAWAPHPRLADYFRDLADPAKDRTWQGGSLRPFNEIAFHLQGAARWDDLCAYLTDFRCLDRRIRSGQVFAVVTDQRAAQAALPELAEEARREKERVGICARYGEAMISYARDCAAGKHPSLPEPPDARGMAEAGSASEEVSPRADRLRAITNFTADKATFLADLPEDFLPLAANAAANGPLNDAAAALLALGLPWLQRSPRPPIPPLRPQCLLTLQGHTGYVTSVALSPDGSRALSGSSTLRLWDLHSGECLLTLQGHAYGVNSVALSPDGSRALSGSVDRTLRLWDLRSGECLHTLLGHTHSVDSVALSPDGSRALSGSYDKTLRVWDLQSGQCLQTLLGHSDGVNSVSVTPDGRHAVSAGGFTLRVWDLQSGQSLLTLQGHTTYVKSVSVTPDGRSAVSASWDNTLRVWDLQSGLCLLTLRGHTDWVNSVSVTPDGRRAVSASRDKTLRVWDLQSGQCLFILQGHSSEVTSVSVTPDGRRAVSDSEYKNLRVWDLQSGQCTQTLQGHPSSVTSVSVTPDGRRAVSASRGDLRVWDLQSGECLHILQGPWGGILSVSVTPDSRRAVSASEDQNLRVWDLQNGLSLLTIRGNTNRVTSVSVTPDGRRLVSATGDSYPNDHTLGVWDLNSGQCLLTLQGHTDGVFSVSVTPDGCRAVSASGDKTLRVWDLKSGLCLQTLQGHTDRVLSVSVTPDGRRAVSASDDKTLRVWDLQSGHSLLTLQGHSGKVISVSVTPDGRHAISTTGDKTLRVWDLQSGQCLQTLFLGHTGGVTCVSVTPDGRRAVSVSWDKTLRLWDLASGQCLAIYQAGASVTPVAISRTGGRIVCGTNDGQMHFLTMCNFPGTALPEGANPLPAAPQSMDDAIPLDQPPQ